MRFFFHFFSKMTTNTQINCEKTYENAVLAMKNTWQKWIPLPKVDFIYHVYKII